MEITKIKNANNATTDIEEETPNQETLKACRELNEGGGVTFTSLDDLFKYLKS
ncbi:MAG: hypothetical protein LBR61_03550 [Synergistaceae bacterium]|jgi:antitoxin component of RelBE/YafQ-DinJ toxin-antitoxin module|nr:hypothetical protein [Synergistaceae bacterium]